MKNQNEIVQVAIASFFALTTAMLSTNADAATAPKMEKCYGIVKAGMNDCQTATASCAGSATKDSQKDAFIFLPEGTCQKIVGSSPTPEKK